MGAFHPGLAPRALFTRAFDMKWAFKAEEGRGGACPWHFTRAFGKKRAFMVRLGFTLWCYNAIVIVKIVKEGAGNVWFCNVHN
jgi:hypothetical protein